MAVQTERWVAYIIDRLWKDNAFLVNAFNEDEYVLGGKVVHIPNPGSKPTVVKNRSSFPGVAVQRTDTDVTYTLDSYTTDPTHITAAELQEITYDKIGSVFGDHAGQLVETVADDMLIKWATGLGTKIYTSGGNTASWVTNQTGNRKLLVHGDVRRTAVKFNTQNVSKKDRFMVLESNQLDQLTQSLSDSQYRDFSRYYDAEANIVGKLYGFTIMERSTVTMASVADAINPLGATVLADDNVAGIAWQKDSLTRAMGERKFFERKDDPLYYGDIYSALLRMGGRRRRADDAGVSLIISAA